MVPSSPSHHSHLATSAAAQAERQRSVLAKLIGTVAPEECERLAGDLLGEFQSLSKIWNQSPEALARILGPHSPVADLIALAREVALISLSGDMRGVRLDPLHPNLRRYLIASMGSLPDERLRVLFLDGGRHLIADEQMQQGSLAQLTLYPRTIFRRALEHNAAGLILVHNHPSGDPEPSVADLEVTRRLDEIGRSLDIEIVDHIIVTAADAHHIKGRNSKARRDATSAPCTLKSPGPHPPWDDEDIAVANAKTAMRRRLLRRQLIGSPELFGEPAWEMLVDLFIHQGEDKELSISSLCVTANMPMSSALRLVQKLCDAGILSRIADPIDGRRSIIKLEPTTSHRLRAYFGAGN